MTDQDILLQLSCLYRLEGGLNPSKEIAANLNLYSMTQNYLGKIDGIYTHSSMICRRADVKADVQKMFHDSGASPMAPQWPSGG